MSAIIIIVIVIIIIIFFFFFFSTCHDHLNLSSSSNLSASFRIREVAFLQLPNSYVRTCLWSVPFEQ